MQIEERFYPDKKGKRMSFGFVRVCCVSPSLKVADCAFNSEKIIEKVRLASKKGASIIVFPELSITGCTCADLFLQKKLQDEAIQSLELIASKTRTLDSLILVGLPVCVENLLYDCAAVIHKGKVLALIPKTFFSTRDGLFQSRYFSSADASSFKMVKISEKIGSVPFGKEILIRGKSTESFVLSVELGEDLASPFSPSIKASLAGANVIANLAVSEETAGKSERRKELVKIHSLRTVSAYLYSNAGSGESSQDSVFSSHSMIFESGTELAEIAPFSKNEMIYADVDVERIMQERRRNQAFFNGDVSVDLSGFRTIEVCMKETRISFNALQRKIPSLPFIPDEK
ncbi:MAG: nitrilase-related carbon-nitrogen hydrolase, partial [Treponema sp.]